MITHSRKYEQLGRQLAKIKAIKARTSVLMREMKLRNTDLTASIDTEIDQVLQDLEKLQKTEIDFEMVSRLPEWPKLLVPMRYSLGWSQTELGRQTGFTKRQISRFERDNYGCTRFGDFLLIASTLYRAYVRVYGASPRESVN
ncbi:MAG TPA: helix-turn-helix transcriptional regulator [Planktothrix sp.]|jgi:DNA-directed RNA polymerase specialized sigma subunit